MSPARILIAAIIGGVVAFAWGAVIHVATPIGEMGFKTLPPEKEQILMPAMRFAITEGGAYRFPACDPKVFESKSKEEQEQAWNAYCDKYSTGPRGLIMFDPEQGVGAMTPKMMGTEFGSNVLACILLALIISKTKSGAGTGALIGLAAGLFATFSIDASYWNWDRFPNGMVACSIVEQGGCGLLAGLAIGLVLGRAKPPMPVVG